MNNPSYVGTSVISDILAIIAMLVFSVVGVGAILYEIRGTITKFLQKKK